MFLKSPLPHSICDPITHPVLKAGKPNRETILDESRPLASPKDDHISSRGGRGSPFPSLTAPLLDFRAHPAAISFSWLKGCVRPSTELRTLSVLYPAERGSGHSPVPPQDPEPRSLSGTGSETLQCKYWRHRRPALKQACSLGAQGVRRTKALAKALPFR